jgi:hypothetical protein
MAQAEAKSDCEMLNVDWLDMALLPRASPLSDTCTTPDFPTESSQTPG